MWRIGDFYEELLDIGEGGYTEVFEAKKKASPGIGNRSHIHENDSVAVKKIFVSLTEPGEDIDKRDWKSLDTEFRTSSILEHKNCMRAEDILVDNQYAYVVQEHMECDLELNLRTGTHPRTARIFRQVLEGLDYIHSKNIVHSDMKLANILLKWGREDDSADSVTLSRICDFGLSNFVDMRNRKLKRYTILGTKGYEAPEVINQFIYSEASDVWALGVTLFEALTYKRPFASQDDIMRKEPDWEHLSNRPESLRKLIRDMLTKDVDSRRQ